MNHFAGIKPMAKCTCNNSSYWNLLYKMAVIYTHLVALWFLLALILPDVAVAEGLGGPVKGHFRRKDFPDYEKFWRREAPNNVSRNQSQQNAPEKQNNEIEDIHINVTRQTRTTVVLHCNTSLLISPGVEENTTVLWVRLYNDSFDILTYGKRVVTADKRIYSLNKTDPKDWSLYIRYAKWEDQGMYKCQLCAHSNFTNSIFVNLTLIEAFAEIIGDPVREVDKVGSPLRLSCELKNSIQAPKYIYWYHEDRMINYDLGDGANVRQGRQGSELIFPRAEKNHAGNYSCVPSNARLASVTVKIKAKTYAEDSVEKSGGKKSQPQNLAINMLLLVSPFLLCR